MFNSLKNHSITITIASYNFKNRLRLDNRLDFDYILKIFEFLPSANMNPCKKKILNNKTFRLSGVS